MTTSWRVISGAVCLLAATPVWAQTGPWTVSEANGRVTVTDAKGARPAVRGMVIEAGASVTTMAGSRAVIVRRQEFVTISANSRIRVPEAVQQAGIVQMLQDWGNALFRIDKQPKPHFGVKTPYLAAVVKGTTFSITVSREGASMQVVEGAVEVSTDDGGARDLIRPGSVAMVAAGDRYRLTVQGAEAHVVDSPARATAKSTATAPAASAQPAVPETFAEPGGAPGMDAWSTTGGARSANDVIVTAIQLKPVDFGVVTGGLVGGTSAVVTAAMAITPATSTIVPAPSPPSVATEPVVAADAGQPVADTAAAIAAADEAARVKAAETAAQAAQERVAEERRAAEAAAALAATEAQRAAQSAEAQAMAERNAIEEGRKAAEELARQQAKAADAAAKAAAEATRKAADDAAKAARDADEKKAADDAAKKAADDAQRAKDEAAQDAAKAADDARKAADKAADDAKAAADKAAEEVRKSQDKAAEDARKAADEIAKRDAEKAAEDAKKALEDAKKALDDLAKKSIKDAKDADDQDDKKSTEVDDDDDDGEGEGKDDDDD